MPRTNTPGLQYVDELGYVKCVQEQCVLFIREGTDAMTAEKSIEWIRAGVVGTVDFDGDGFGFVLCDKKGKTTPIVEYAANDCHDAVTGEHAFTVYRILLHPVTYTDGCLRFGDRKYVDWQESVANNARSIISLCCGNLVERARIYIEHDLPIAEPEWLPRDNDPEDEKAAWMAQHPHVFESLPFRITLAQARLRYSAVPYTEWQTWPPDRSLSLLHYDGDAWGYVEDDPNEVYEWRSRKPGFYVRHDDGEFCDVIGGPFDTPEQAREWAWTAYHDEPCDVPHWPN